MSIADNLDSVKKYMDTLSMRGKEKEEISNLILGYMSDCQSLEQQVKELRAHNARLRGILINRLDLIRCGIGSNYGGYPMEHELYTSVERVITETECQSLAALQAEAIEQAIEKVDADHMVNAVVILEEYVAQLKASANG